MASNEDYYNQEDEDEFDEMVEDDEEDEDLNEEVEEEESEDKRISLPGGKIVPNELRSTPTFMNKFEFPELIRYRSEMIVRGDPIFLSKEELGSLTAPQDVATLELLLHRDKLPLLVVRTVPSGDREIWRLEELTLPVGIIDPRMMR